MVVAIRCAFALAPEHAPSTVETIAIASDADPDGDAVSSSSSPSSSLRIVACHAHFSGDLAKVPREIVSRVFSTANDVFEIEVPSDARDVEALRVTLAQRFRGGWLRHSRARIPLVGLPKKFDLKNEQLDGTTYGTVEASWVVDGNAPRGVDNTPRESGEVYREWFFAPDSASRVVAKAKKRSTWFEGKEPTRRGGELSKRVHMPTWNNQSDSIPGSFFAFSCRRETSRHSRENLEDVFCEIARPLVGGTTCRVEGRPRLRGEWLATGLMAFGKSVQYQGDRTVDASNIVERFSSSARLDGLGDCEDIAKETAMAHADLVATETAWTRAEKITETCVNMCALVDEAKKYACVIALCTVRRHPGSKIEAHAFAMLLPWCAFKGGERESGDRWAFVADGTYPCDPSSKNEAKDGVRPWKYEHVVSALVYGEGEIYFRYDDEEKGYGVSADDLFPFVSKDVVIEWGYRVGDETDRNAIERVLASNLPTTARTFQYETDTPSQRFRELVRWHDVDTKKMFENATPEEKRRIRIASAGFRTSCPSRRTFEARLKLTEDRVEHAGDLDAPGQKHVGGGYGSVPTVDGVVNPYHTHHRPRGHSKYLDHNAPTPDDVAIFVAGRAAGLVVLARGSEDEGRVQATSTVITRNNMYEMSMVTDRADDVVTALWWKAMTDASLNGLNEFETLRNALLPIAMKTVERAVVGEGKWVKYDEANNPTLLVDITKDKKEHDRYLRAYEESMGVRVSYLPTKEYTSECGLKLSKIFYA